MNVAQRERAEVRVVPRVVANLVTGLRQAPHEARVCGHPLTDDKECGLCLVAFQHCQECLGLLTRAVIEGQVWPGDCGHQAHLDGHRLLVVGSGGATMFEKLSTLALGIGTDCTQHGKRLPREG